MAGTPLNQILPRYFSLRYKYLIKKANSRIIISILCNFEELTFEVVCIKTLGLQHILLSELFSKKFPKHFIILYFWI